MKKIVILLAALAAVFVAFGTNPAPVQTFFAPLPEQDVLQALKTIYNNGTNGDRPVSPMHAYMSISISEDDTVVYYDHWENGYEIDIANPNHVWSRSNPMGTEIWGDGDPSNGCAPGCPQDRLYGGDVIVLKHDDIDVSRIGTVAYYDGRDKFAVTKPVACSRAVWASGSRTLFAGANEMYDTTFAGTEFVVPVGEDTANQQEIFQYTGLSVMAVENGTVVEIDKDGDGSVDVRKELNAGEACLIDGGCREGATVTAASGAVQVELLTGDVNDNFESRFMKLLPTEKWSSGYTCPVATKSDYATKIWFYNPYNATLKVLIETQSRSSTIDVPAGTAKDVIVGASSKTGYTKELSGVHVSADRPFYALATIDCVGTTRSDSSRGGGSNRTFDWGFSLVPDDSLSAQVVVGLGLGYDPASSKRENGAPVWVTCPDGDTTVYVDYDGQRGTGRYTDANGNRYDKKLDLRKLQFACVYDDSGDNDQTGMTLWTLDGKRIACAWGEDPSKASAGEPGVDMGTGIPPMAQIFVSKTSLVVTDADGDGYVSVGDRLEYSVKVLSMGRSGVHDMNFHDDFPSSLEYVPESFRVVTPWNQERALADADFARACTAEGFSFDTQSAFSTDIKIGDTWTFVYRATVKAGSVDKVENTAFVSVGGIGGGTAGGEGGGSSVDYLRSKVGSSVWIDANRNGIRDEGERPMKGVTVTLLDAAGTVVRDDRDVPYTAVTGADGQYLFTGVKSGDYRVRFEAADLFKVTVKGAGDDRAIDSDANHDGVSDVFTVVGGRDVLVIDAGFYLDTDAGLTVVKTASAARIDAGDTVTYTYKVTNTGSNYLKDVKVVDDKLGLVGAVEGVLAPGQTVVFTKSAALEETVTNVGTVSGTPTDAKGTDYGISEGVVGGSDTATVEVTPRVGSLVGTAWFDIGNDGVRGPEDFAVADVDAVIRNAAGEIVKTVTTGPEGGFDVSDLAPGDYAVEFQPVAGREFASGAMVQVNVPAGGQGGADVRLTLADGAAVLRVVKTAGDAPDGTNLVVASGSTVTYTYVVYNNGITAFSNVTVADDKLGEIGSVDLLRAGETRTFSASAVIGADTVNVATVTGTPCTADGSPLSGTAVTVTDDATVSVYTPGFIGDSVWADANKNGVRDADESGLGGVTVMLLGADGETVAATVTDAGGAYGFDGLKPGSYTVVFSAPVNYSFVVTPGDSAVDVNGRTPVYTITPTGERILTADAGLALNPGQAYIAVEKTADPTVITNKANVTYTYRVRNTGSVDLANVTLVDDKISSLRETIELLRAGEECTFSKTVRITSSTVNVATVTGTPVNEQGVKIDEPITATDNAKVTVQQMYTIGDKVWFDLDGDGRQNDGPNGVLGPGPEGGVGVPGVRVELWNVSKNAIVKDPVTQEEFVTVTDENGHYEFTHVPRSSGYLRFVPPAGFTYSPFVNIGSTSWKWNSDVADFTGGFTEKHNWDCDSDWKDCGLVCTGAVVRIVKTAQGAADGEVAQCEIGAEAVYTYEITNAGMFKLDQIQIEDDKLGLIVEDVVLEVGESKTFEKRAVLTADTVNVATVTARPVMTSGDRDIPCGAVVTAHDDAEVVMVDPTPATLGDLVWADLNGNGVQDAGEDGVYGVTVDVVDMSGAVIVSTVTDAAGRWKVEVPAGEYKVVFKPGSTWRFTTQDAADDGVDSDADVNGVTAAFTVVPAQVRSDIDCGLVGGVLPGICDYLAIAGHYNAVIGGNLTTTGGDSEGSVLVAGNADLWAGYSVGLIGPGYGRTRDAAEPGTDALVVGGDLIEGARPDINGNVVYGGEYVNKTSHYNARVYEQRHVTPVTIDENGNVPGDGSGRSLAAVMADLRKFSDYAAALPETATSYLPDVPEDQAEYTAVTNFIWTSSNADRNVFEVRGDVWKIVSNGYRIDCPADSKVLVNVFSREVRFVRGSIELPQGMSPSQVVFNFVNAETISIESIDIPGAVIAPKATFSGAQGAIQGFAFIGGDATGIGGFEFHDFEFKAFDCSRSKVVTDRPGLAVSLTAGDERDGEVVMAVLGAHIVYHVTIANAGADVIREVAYTDILGNTVELGDLAAGETKGFDISYPASTGVKTVTATAKGAVGSAYENVTVAKSATVTVDASWTSPEAMRAAREARETARYEGGTVPVYSPRPDFEVVSLKFVEDAAPTVTGDVFSVVAVIKNVGEIAAVPGSVGVYVDHPETVVAGETADRVVTHMKPVNVGDSFEVTFTGLKATGTSAQHIRVMVDCEDEVMELSEGNNQLDLFAFLSKITMGVEVGTRAVTITWNSFDGQVYTVLASDTLGASLEDFEPVEGAEEIPSEGEGQIMSVTIDLPEDGRSRFFRIRAVAADDVL